MIRVSDLPATISGKRMLKFVAPVYENSLYIKRYFDALGVDFDLLNRYFSTLQNQAHIPTVDWGIEFLERKYSIEPDPRLTLEERRERLRIKATQHPPISPAFLERHALEKYGFTCFLDEKTPGYITVIANEFPSTAPDFLFWLTEEKPAHLALGGRFVKAWYVGDESLAEPDDEPRVTFEPAVPIDDDDKRHFPRLFVGNADLRSGEVELSLAHPTPTYETQAFAETVNFIFGRKEISLRKPELDFDAQIFAAQILSKVGNIKIDTSTKPHDDEDIIAHSWTAKIFAETVNLVHGRQIWSMSRPKNQQATLTAGTVDVQTGSLKLKPSTLRDSQTTITAGQVLTKSGEIKIDTSTKPTSTDNFFGHSSTAHVCAQTADVQSGNITVDKNPIPKRYAVVRVGQVLTCAGFVTIGASDSDWHDLPDDGDWLKLRFRFPNLGKRFVTLPDPRDDLEKDDIREVGNFAAEKGMLLNSDREPTSGIDLAMLIKRNIRKIF